MARHSQDPEQASKQNFLYYVYKKFRALAKSQAIVEAQQALEDHMGIFRIPSRHNFDVETQVVELGKLDLETLDPRLNGEDFSFLKRSDALILNIDYPLGLAAYKILSRCRTGRARVGGVRDGQGGDAERQRRRRDDPQRGPRRAFAEHLPVQQLLLGARMCAPI